MDSYIFVNSLLDAESSYLDLVKENWKAQQARDILPLATKTELIMTGTVSQWKDFFELRCSERAHPDAQYLANQLKEEFIKRGYITKSE